MFEPVVKATVQVALGGRARAPRWAVPRRSRRRRRAGRSTSRSPPTCSARRRGRPRRPTPRSGRRRRRDEQHLAQAIELLERARRPLIWAGGGALQAGAGEAVARLAERLVAPVILTYSARGLLPPGHPCLVDAPPHVPEVGALWDEADVVHRGRQRPRRDDDPGLEAAAAAAPDRDQRRPDRRRQELPARPAARVPTRREGAAALAERASERGRPRGARAARLRELHGAVRDGARPRPIPRRSASSRRSSAPLPDDAIVVCDMCIPGYWLGGFHRTPRAAQARLPAGLGHARLRLPAGARRRACAAPARPSASPGTAASCTPAASWRRPPRSGSRSPRWSWTTAATGCCASTRTSRATPTTASTCTRPTSRRWPGSFGVRADEVDGLGERFEGMLGHHLRLDEPSRARGEGRAAAAAERVAALVPALSSAQLSSSGSAPRT